MSKNIHRKQYQGREIWIVIVKLQEAQYRKLGELKTPWDPVIGGLQHFCEFYLQEPQWIQVLIEYWGENSPHVSAGGEKKGTILKYARAFWSS